MGSIHVYKTVNGKRYLVRYRKPDRSQAAKRGFTTKRDARAYLVTIESSIVAGLYLTPRRSRADVAEFPRVTPHNLRHTAASLAISVGANVKAVQRMLGHASAAMTLDTYADLFEDDLDTVSTAMHAARERSLIRG